MTTGEKVVVLGAIGVGLLVVGYIYYKNNIAPGAVAAASAGAALPAAGAATTSTATAATLSTEATIAANTNLQAYDRSPLATAISTGTTIKRLSAVATPEEPPTA